MLAVILVVVAIVAVALAWLAWPRAEPESLAVAVSQTGRADPVAATVTVTVAGDVAEPGLVELPAGSRVADVIDAAGGIVPETSSAGYLNLARKISDGELILVEARTENTDTEDPEPGDDTPADPDEPNPPGDSPAPINLNAATLDDLVTLPGIGPVTAQNILDYREANGGFDSVDQLQEVTGIGPATLAELTDLVMV